MSKQIDRWIKSRSITEEDIFSGKIGFSQEEQLYFLALDVITDYHIFGYTPSKEGGSFRRPAMSLEELFVRSNEKKLRLDPKHIGFSGLDESSSKLGQVVLDRLIRRQLPFFNATEFAFILLSERGDSLTDFIHTIET